MKVEDALKNWVSVKSFRDKEVEEEKLEKIFSLVTRSPTAFNLQPYRFIVLSSEEAKNKAADSAINTNKWIGYADKIVVLVGYEDIDRNVNQVMKEKRKDGAIDDEKEKKLRKMFENYKERSREFLTGWLTRNTLIPATFFMIGCRAEGIGSCPVRGFNQEVLKEQLELDEKERPILLIPVGYPKEKNRRNWRRDAEEIFEIR